MNTDLFSSIKDGDVELNNYDNDDNEIVGFDFVPLEVAEIDTQKRKRVNIPKIKETKDLLKVIPYPTNKNKIKQRPMMKEKIIPKHPSRVIFNGKSGSGKSNLLIFLCSQPHLYGRTNPKDEESGYFDIVFLFSPTADGADDLVKYLNLPESRIIKDFDIKALENIIKIQEEIIKTKSLEKSPKILIIFDDCQSDQKFLNKKSVMRCWIQGRHLNMSIFACGQSWTKFPRYARLQCSNIFFFPSSQSEVDLLVNEYTPANTKKKDFEKLVKHATKEQYNFLHINCDAPIDKRFRKNLDSVIKIKS
jgi:hypothetical protein